MMGPTSGSERQAAVNRLSKQAFELGLYERNKMPECGKVSPVRYFAAIVVALRSPRIADAVFVPLRCSG
jgi:hypothetical protein